MIGPTHNNISFEPIYQRFIPAMFSYNIGFLFIAISQNDTEGVLKACINEMVSISIRE